MAARGVLVTYETVRRWCDKFGTQHEHVALAEFDVFVAKQEGAVNQRKGSPASRLQSSRSRSSSNCPASSIVIHPRFEFIRSRITRQVRTQSTCLWICDEFQ